MKLDYRKNLTSTYQLLIFITFITIFCIFLSGCSSANDNDEDSQPDAHPGILVQFTLPGKTSSTLDARHPGDPIIAS